MPEVTSATGEVHNPTRNQRSKEECEQATTAFSAYESGLAGELGRIWDAYGFKPSYWDFFTRSSGDRFLPAHRLVSHRDPITLAYWTEDLSDTSARIIESYRRAHGSRLEWAQLLASFFSERGTASDALADETLTGSANPSLMDELRQALTNVLSEYPVEAGVENPAERIILAYSVADPVGTALAVEALLEDPSFEFKPDLIICAGRSRGALPASNRRSIVLAGLRNTDPRQRYAAVRAAELWRDLRVADVLRNHREGEGWLRSYIARVLVDISE